MPFTISLSTNLTAVLRQIIMVRIQELARQAFIDAINRYVRTFFVELRKQTPVLTGALKAGWIVNVNLNRAPPLVLRGHDMRRFVSVSNSQVYWRWICYGRKSPHRGLIGRVHAATVRKLV